jgi:drug/metabolite transporter (DMT)-like permease
VLMLAPVFAVLGAWLFLGEHLPGMTLAGIGVVMAGTACAVFIRNDANQREPGEVTARGLLLALVGSAFVGLGAVAARQAYEGPAMDAFVATVLRVVWAAVLLGIFLVMRREFVSSMLKLHDRQVMARFIPGVLAGPSIGMICYVTALKHTEAGVVSTLSAASPLFMLPMVWYRYKSRIGWRVAMATVAGLAGVAMICLAPK